MSSESVGLTRYRLKEGRNRKSGPTAWTLIDKDAQSARMATALTLAIGSDYTRLNALLDKLRTIANDPEGEPFTVGLNDHAITVTPAEALLWDDYLDGELGETENGATFTHNELREALDWWKLVVDRWHAERQV